jgi:hypothetical protein
MLKPFLPHFFAACVEAFAFFPAAMFFAFTVPAPLT